MLACYTGFQVLWAGAVLTRLRRAGADEARQLRWFVYAVSVSLLLLVVGQRRWRTPLIGLLALPLVPLAAGVAIVRYRLYDIDPVINKTLVVGAMALLISVGYVAVVVGVGALLPVDDPMLALAATAVVAVAFEPVRRRAQALADRLVYGARPTPYETLSRLSAQLTHNDAGLLDGLAATIAGGVGRPRSRSGWGTPSAWRPSRRGRRGPTVGHGARGAGGVSRSGAAAASRRPGARGAGAAQAAG